MNLAETIEKEQMEMGWWVEIITTKPYCTYYFGPFADTKEAVLVQDGYIEDLVTEGAQGITVQIKWCKPRELTIFPKDELAESSQMWGYLKYATDELAGSSQMWGYLKYATNDSGKLRCAG